VLAGLGVIVVAAGVTAYASVSVLAEAKKWGRLRKPFARFMEHGVEALKVPLEAVEFTRKFMHEISTIASGAAAMYELDSRTAQRRAENQATADQAKAEREAKEASSKGANAEAPGDKQSSPGGGDGKVSGPEPERRSSATFGPQPPPGPPVRDPPLDDGTGNRPR
jgi:hypothetical protein